jgi:hypothetical protein
VTDFERRRAGRGRDSGGGDERSTLTLVQHIVGVFGVWCCLVQVQESRLALRWWFAFLVQLASLIFTVRCRWFGVLFAQVFAFVPGLHILHHINLFRLLVLLLSAVKTPQFTTVHTAVQTGDAPTSHQAPHQAGRTSNVDSKRQHQNVKVGTYKFPKPSVNHFTEEVEEEKSKSIAARAQVLEKNGTSARRSD